MLGRTGTTLGATGGGQWEPAPTRITKNTSRGTPNVPLSPSGALQDPNIAPKNPKARELPGISGGSSPSPGTCGMGGRWSRGAASSGSSGFTQLIRSFSPPASCCHSASSSHPPPPPPSEPRTGSRWVKERVGTTRGKVQGQGKGRNGEGKDWGQSAMWSKKGLVWPKPPPKAPQMQPKSSRFGLKSAKVASNPHKMGLKSSKLS